MAESRTAIGPVGLERAIPNDDFAYVGPEVVLPMASVVAAAFGFVMMVGRAPFRIAGRWIRAVRTGGKKEPRPRPSGETITFNPA